MIIVPTFEVGGFCIEKSKLLGVYLRRVELGEHFDGTL
jgi:hypothetical protein